MGYRYVLGTDYLTVVCDGTEDVCAGRGVPVLAEREWALLDSTPIGPVAHRLGADPPAGSDVLLEPEAVVAKAQRTKEPFFLYMHLLIPHPPYRYTPDCAHRDVSDPSLSEWGLGTGENLEHYEDSIRCTNRAILRTVDRIAASDPGAIVVMEGDHGSAFEVPDTAPIEWPADALHERYSIFSAARFPRGCPQEAPTLSVNTFRLVFSCVTGRRVPLLEPKFFSVYYSHYDDVKEIPAERVLGGAAQ
jgi:hypothetical protein